MSPARTRPIGPYHHVGGVYLTSQYARLDAPTLRVWVRAPEVMAWPRRGPDWRESIISERPRTPAGWWPRLRLAWRVLSSDREELLP